MRRTLEHQAKEIASQKFAFAKNPAPWPQFWKARRQVFIKQLKEHWHEFIPNAGFHLQELFDISVLCLTEAENDLLMWAHYANGHKGFLIEFEPEDDFFKKSKLFKVEYRETRPLLNLEATNEEKQQCVVVKGLKWEYEIEWRMFKNWQKAPKKLLEEGGLFDIPGSALRRVIIGYRAVPALKSKLLHLLEKKEYRHIQMQRAHPSSFEFKLDYVQLNSVP